MTYERDNEAEDRCIAIAIMFAMIAGYVLVMLLVGWLTSAPAYGQNVKTYIPTNAYKYLPLMKTEVDAAFPNFEYKRYFGGLVEQESCISLKHSRCWDPTSELKTARERGAGLGQLTKAYNADGTIRFDSLEDVRRANMRELRELSWQNITQRPDLQIRTILIMSKKNYNVFFDVDDEYERLAMADVAYNAGPGRVKKNRLVCSLTQGCDSERWFDNVENYCTASKKPIYGTRSACDIMTEHVNNVMKIRMEKYRPYFEPTQLPKGTQ